MDLLISFYLNTFADIEEALNLATQNLYFKPVAINSSKSYSDKYYDFRKEIVIQNLKKNKDDNFTIADKKYRYHDEKNSVFFRRDYFHHVEYFIFTFEKIDVNWIRTIITIAHQKKFFLAFLYNPFACLWQNEKFIEAYERENRPYKHLKTFWDPVLSPIYNEEVIDIFYNAGHKKITHGTWLMAAPEIWFSKNAWKYFNKEKIKAFKDAVTIEEWQEDLLYVKLFDANVEDYEVKEILELQAKFREWSEMNRIEKELDEISKAKNAGNKNANITAIQTIVIDPNSDNNNPPSEDFTSSPN